MEKLLIITNSLEIECTNAGYKSMIDFMSNVGELPQRLNSLREISSEVLNEISNTCVQINSIVEINSQILESMKGFDSLIQESLKENGDTDERQKNLNESKLEAINNALTQIKEAITNLIKALN